MDEIFGFGERLRREALGSRFTNGLQFEHIVNTLLTGILDVTSQMSSRTYMMLTVSKHFSMLPVELGWMGTIG